MSNTTEDLARPGTQEIEPLVTDLVQSIVRERNATFEQDRRTAQPWDKRDFLVRLPKP